MYKLQIILKDVIVDWTDEFDRWLDHAEKQGGQRLTLAVALLQALTDLPAKPAEESATFKRVRQARRHELWRVAHPFDPEVAVRIICWFPADDNVVIALIGFDKKTIRGRVLRKRRSTRRSTRRCLASPERRHLMTEDVRFIRGNDRISQLAQRPDLAADVAQVRRDMAEADRTYAMGLAALRQAAELTQVELGKRMGITQAAVSRMEQPHDLLLSTLNAYLEAVGGHASVIVRFADGHQAELDLSRLT